MWGSLPWPGSLAYGALSVLCPPLAPSLLRVTSLVPDCGPFGAAAWLLSAVRGLDGQPLPPQAWDSSRERLLFRCDM